MARKYKQIILGALLILGTVVFFPAAPTSAAGEIPAGCPGSKIQGPPSVDCSQYSGGASEDCASTGTCADCSAASSNASGCIDCGEDGSGCRDGAVTKTCNRDGCDLVSKLLNPIIVLLSGLVGLAVALSIIVGSIQYAASAGDPQKAAKGRDRIKNAVIALVAYLFLFAFLNFIIPGGLL